MHPSFLDRWTPDLKETGAQLYPLIIDAFEPMIRSVYGRAINIAPEDLPDTVVAVEKQKLALILRGEFGAEYEALQQGIIDNLLATGIDWQSYMSGYADYQAGITGLVVDAHGRGRAEQEKKRRARAAPPAEPFDLNAAVLVVQLATTGDSTVTLERFFHDMQREAAGERQRLLDRLFSSIGKRVQELARVSTDMRTTFDALEQRTMSQAASLEENTASMTELSGTVSETASSAQRSAELANAANQQSHSARAELTATQDAITSVVESTANIRNFVDVVDKIALQTKLLALNASVEAARAGDHGRGFGVVATEVRALAEQSSKSAAEVAEVIGDITDKMDRITLQSERLSDTLEALAQGIAQVAETFGAIEAMTRDQSASVQQVGAVQHQLDGITQENASAVNEAAEQVRLLDRIVEEIGGRIGEFQADARVDEVPLSSAA